MHILCRLLHIPSKLLPVLCKLLHILSLIVLYNVRYFKSIHALLSRICQFYNLRTFVYNLGPQNSGPVKVLTNIMYEVIQFGLSLKACKSSLSFLRNLFACLYNEGNEELVNGRIFALLYIYLGGSSKPRLLV